MQGLAPQSEALAKEAENINVTQGRFISSKDWTVQGLLAQGRRFCEVPRVSALDPEAVAKAFLEYEHSGVPLIIEHLDQTPKWPKDMFSIDWLSSHFGDKGCIISLFFVSFI